MATMLYRPGEAVNEAAWGLKVDFTIVEDGALDAALSDGWYRHPDDFPAPEVEAAPEAAVEAPVSPLDAKVADIVPTLADLTAEELAGLLEAENAGKARVGLIAAIEKAQTALSEG